jgi:hypothetical protein
MRLLIKIVIVLVILFAGYFGYKYFTAPEGEKPTIGGALKDLKDTAGEKYSNAHMSKAESLYKLSKNDKDYKAALEEYKLALKAEDLSDRERRNAMRRLGDCWFKIWDWGKEKDRSAARKALSAYKALLKKYPDEQPKVEKAMQRLKISADLK